MCSKNLPRANTVISTTHVTGSCLGSDAPLILRLHKVELIWKPALNQEYTGFPAKIWISKCYFLMVFAIKMLLDNAYGLLNLLEFKCNHFDIIFQAESEYLIIKKIKAIILNCLTKATLHSTDVAQTMLHFRQRVHVMCTCSKPRANIVICM